MNKKQCYISTMAAVLIFLFVTREVSAQNGNFESFYENKRENVVFECDVLIPDKVISDGIYRMEVNGYVHASIEAVLNTFGKNDGKADSYNIPGSDGQPDWEVYTYEDGAQIIAGGATSYSSSDFSRYTRIGVMSEQSMSIEEKELKFTSAQQCIDQTGEILKELKIPKDKFEYQWGSFDQNELEDMEAAAYENGLLETDEQKDFWTAEDEIYIIYGIQYEQKVPVFHELMGLYQSFALDSMDNAVVMAVYSLRGMEFFSLGKIYDLNKTDQKADLKEFENAAETVAEKYNSLLMNEKYRVTEAKFFQMVRRNEKQELECVPIWRFLIKNEKGKQFVTLVHAETSQEIYLK